MNLRGEGICMAGQFLINDYFLSPRPLSVSSMNVQIKKDRLRILDTGQALHWIKDRRKNVENIRRLQF